MKRLKCIAKLQRDIIMTSLTKIAIDGNEANVQQRVGSNAYAYELLVALEKILQNRPEIEVTVLLSHTPQADLPADRPGWKYVVFGPAPFWTQWALPWYLFNYRNEYQVFFTPGHYAPRISAVPYVSSVMDLAFLHYPQQFKKKDWLQLTEWTRYSVKHAQRVIAISEFTKQDLVKSYQLPADRIVVAHPGVQLSEFAKLKEKEKMLTLSKWQITQPYLLYVGTLQPRKNLGALLRAFELVIQQASQPDKNRRSKSGYTVLDAGKLASLKLVIAGKIGWLADPILQQIQASPVKDRIILTGYVSEAEKHLLYQQSLASVLVGLYEGFGIPPLEAMAAGTIPVVSNSSSLPEVVGDAGVQVNPQDVKAIAHGLQEVLSLPAKERATMLKKGRQQLKKFQWTDSAEIVLETLLKVAATPHHD